MAYTQGSILFVQTLMKQSVQQDNLLQIKRQVNLTSIEINQSGTQVAAGDVAGKIYLVKIPKSGQNQ